VVSQLTAAVPTRAAGFPGRARPTLGHALTVAAIVAMMSAILLPVAQVLRRDKAAREQVGDAAALSACIRQVTGLARALVAYAEAHDGRLPQAADWQAAVLPYLQDGSSTVEAKPPDPEAARVGGSLPRCPLDGGLVSPQSYYMPPSLSGANLRGLADPRRTVLLYEGYVRPDGQQVIAFTRHRSANGREGCVVGYADGHVAFVPFPTSSPTATTQGPPAPPAGRG